MQIAVYSSKTYEQAYFSELNDKGFKLCFYREPLSKTTVSLSREADAICCFVNDDLSADVLHLLAKQKARLILLRSAGFDHVDISEAKKQKFTVLRVPNYSPEAIAEFATAMLLALSRHIVAADRHVKQLDFRLDSLLGSNLYEKTIGIIGTGRIGTAFARIMRGFSCNILAYDPFPNEACHQLGVKYTSISDVLTFSDVVSLHCPLNDETRYIIDSAALEKMQPSAILINTGRGQLVDTRALVAALNTGEIASAGLDVYEYEKALFFKKHKPDTVHDEIFKELAHMPNVLLTPHQAFLTRVAVKNIVQQTLDNCCAYQIRNFQKDTIVITGE